MVSIIAAIGKNNELGLNNNLIWHLSGDMKFFKTITTGKTVIMGRKCFESLPNILPNRKNIIITSNPNYKASGATIINSIKDAITYIENSEEDIFIIGGAKIYEEFLPYVENIYLTEIDAESLADVYFPNFDKNNNQQYSFSGKRIKRGLYKTKNNKTINADLNILKKYLIEKVAWNENLFSDCVEVSCSKPTICRLSFR